jgi:hypothetical protein
MDRHGCRPVQGQRVVGRRTCDPSRKRALTDMHISVARMIYSSITPYVHLLRTAEHEHEHTMLDFSESGQRGGMARYMREFGVGVRSRRQR